MAHLFLAASLTNLATISLERAHASFRPFRHRIIKKWVFGFIITIIWVTSGLVPIALYLDDNLGSYYYKWNSFNGFCLFIVCVSYVSIVVKLSCGAHPQHHGVTSRDRKLTKTLFIVTLVSFLMWLSVTISLPLFDTVRFRPLYMIHLVRAFNVLLLILQTLSSILFYMRSECQTLKELSFYSFDVSKDELRLFPSVPCNDKKRVCCHITLLCRLQQQRTTICLYQKQRKKLQLINFDLNKKVGSSGSRNNYDEII